MAPVPPQSRVCVQHVHDFGDVHTLGGAAHVGKRPTAGRPQRVGDDTGFAIPVPIDEPDDRSIRPARGITQKLHGQGRGRMLGVGQIGGVTHAPILTVDAGGSPIVTHKSIPLIQPAQQQTVNFGNFNLPTSAFGAKATVKVEVGPVAGEINTANNAASYTVFFTLS